MQEYLNSLSTDLRFIRQESHGDTLWIYCETESIKGKKVHSRVERVVKDLNYGNHKVELHIMWKKYFNDDPKIAKLTVSEKMDFIPNKGRRTKRLNELLLSMQKEMSAIGCERLIKEKIANVSDTTILRMLKKTNKST